MMGGGGEAGAGGGDGEVHAEYGGGALARFLAYIGRRSRGLRALHVLRRGGDSYDGACDGGDDSGDGSAVSGGGVVVVAVGSSRRVLL